MQGQSSRHPVHGSQFKAEVCVQSLPATLACIEGYRGSVQAGGTDRGEIQGRHLQRDRAHSGTPSEGSRDRHRSQWQDHKSLAGMGFLHSHGVSTNLAVKIYKTYGDRSLETAQKNPYQLERDIYGVGLKTADRIARALGLPVDHPSRVEAGIAFALNEMIDEGHMFVPRESLGGRAVELLDRLAQKDCTRAECEATQRAKEGTTPSCRPPNGKGWLIHSKGLLSFSGASSSAGAVSPITGVMPRNSFHVVTRSRSRSSRIATTNAPNNVHPPG
jgi:hypothetical protein